MCQVGSLVRLLGCGNMRASVLVSAGLGGWEPRISSTRHFPGAQEWGCGAKVMGQR